MNYNFQQNLLKASESNDIIEAKMEWKMMSEQKVQNRVLCICNHKISNVTYFLNTKTKNIINIGSTCKNKFGMDNIPKIKNKLILKFLSKNLKNNEYGCITDIKKYCEDVQKELFEYLESKIEKYILNNKKLQTYKDYILDLESLNLGLNFDNILEKININQDKIKIKKEIELKEKEERNLRIEQEANMILIELKKSRELELKEAEERKLKEKEKQIKESECECGIEYINICNCKKPKFELYFKHLWCTKCDKCKCRCVK